MPDRVHSDDENFDDLWSTDPPLPEGLGESIHSTTEYLYRAIDNVAESLKIKAGNLTFTPSQLEHFARTLRRTEDDLVEHLRHEFRKVSLNRERMAAKDDHAVRPTQHQSSSASAQHQPHDSPEPISPGFPNSPLLTDDATNVLAKPKQQQLNVDVDFEMNDADPFLERSAPSSPSAQELLGSQNGIGEINGNNDGRDQLKHQLLPEETPRRVAQDGRKSLIPRPQTGTLSRRESSQMDDYAVSSTQHLSPIARTQHQLHYSPEPILHKLLDSPLPTDDATNVLAKPKQQQLNVDVDFEMNAADPFSEGSAPSTPRRVAHDGRKSLIPRPQTETPSRRESSQIGGAASQLAPQTVQGPIRRSGSHPSEQSLNLLSASRTGQVVAQSPQGNAHRSQSPDISSQNTDSARKSSSIPRLQVLNRGSVQATQQPAVTVPKQNGTGRQRYSMRLMELKQRDAEAEENAEEEDEEFPFESKFDENADDEEPGLADVDLVVIGKRSHSFVSRRVMFQEPYVCRTAIICSEARRGQRGGSHRLDYKNFPGIPDRKFNELDEVPNRAQWPVQAIYQVERVPDTFYVHYEGWAFESEKQTRNELQHLTQVFRSFECRTKFLNAFKRLNPELADVVDKHLYLCDEYIDNTKHHFWTFEDVGFFHSQINAEKRGAPVFYFNLLKNEEKPGEKKAEPVPPPKYGFVQTNVIRSEAFDHCKRRHANKRFVKLNEDYKPVKDEESPCDGLCLCNERFKSLYGNRPDIINLIPSKDGKLDLTGVALSSRRIVIECTDACGCGPDCPRRQLQNCKEKALVVNFEGEGRGFGVCTAEDIDEGELVTEYTGLMSKIVRDKKFDASYVADFAVQSSKLMIDAHHLGNVSRFFNHHCDANTMFVETESRRSEDEVLIPRIAVYARRKIKCGERMTLNYYGAGPYKEFTDIECGCGASNCIGFLPLR
ncbi:hypothetical protein CAEBREN_23841 [Caenorhabditis brenneri]|uniref:SET domain-containing protein n=1 Tax=Caenorhabditis brenneri TaxID=135651 RepID=G0NKU8_CAEBE|nr:hypothetical protein CAEBREN_23841 [Caenorhabditis brenneri]